MMKVSVVVDVYHVRSLVTELRFGTEKLFESGAAKSKLLLRNEIILTKGAKNKTNVLRQSHGERRSDGVLP